MGNVGDFFSKVVDEGKSFVDSVGTGLQDAGDFVAKVVKDDAKDLLTVVRNNPFTGPGTRAFVDKIYGDALESTGHKDIADATDPKQKSAYENLAAFGNTALNIGSFIPGFGGAVKAAQQGVKSSKYIKGGAKLIREGSGKKLSSIIDEKRANEIVQKGVENAMPRAMRRRVKEAVADSALDALSDTPAKEIAALLREKPGVLEAMFSPENPLGKVINNFKRSGKYGEKIRAQALIDGQAGDFLNHLGKVTLSKGIRVGADAIKHGVKAGTKQFTAQSANIARKKGERDITYQPNPTNSRVGFTAKTSTSKKKKKKKNVLNRTQY